jgi:sulfate-transporting ATPase
LFTILGAATGALYSLGALGLVLTYRGSGTINFAAGAVGLLGAFSYWGLTSVGVPAAPAVIIGTAASGVLGYLTYLFMWRLRAASQLTRVVGTIVILGTIESGLEIKYPTSNSYVVKPLFPTGPVNLFGAEVGRDRLALLGVALVLTIALALVYQRTRFGLATSAVAENPDTAQIVGWSVSKVAAWNWIIGSALAGLATILLVPIVGLNDGLATVLLLPILGAAVIGNLTSFPLTLLGGLVIGIGQSLVGFYVKSANLTGLSDAIPFVLILGIITIRGRGLPLRSYVGERLPRVTSGRINWLAIAIVAVVGVLLLQWMLPISWVTAVTNSAIVIVPVASLVLLTGFSGQVSLAQWQIAGLAAFSMAHFVVAGYGFGPSILLTLAISVPTGALFGAAALRARGMSLAIATFALGAVVISLVLNMPIWTNEGSGLATGSFKVFGLDLDSTVYPRRFALVCLAVVILVDIGILNIRRGGAGRRLLAVRANERSAVSLGISVYGAKLAAFCYASFVAAVGGILVATQFPAVVFSGFDALTSVNMVQQGVLGGIGFVNGPTLGSQGNPGTVIARLIENIGGASAYQYLVLALGLATIMVLIQSPDGLVALNAKIYRRFRPLKPRTLSGYLPATNAAPPAKGNAVAVGGDAEVPLLEVEQLKVRLGGVQALKGVTLSVRGGEVLGVIGANGAGKTTLIDAVTGFVRSFGGAVKLNGRDLTGRGPRARSALGLGRSFQSLELFEDLTVYENIVASCDHWTAWRWLREPFKPIPPRLSEAATAVVRDLGFDDAQLLAKYPGELSHGTRRLLGMARVLATGSRVVLLDEPAAGLDAAERGELVATVRRLADQGTAVLLVEHDVDLVCRVSDRVLALNFGEVICEGTPDAVRGDPRVVESYLGSDEDNPTLTSAVEA